MSQAELADRIGQALQVTKSCRFDLQGRIKVRLDQQDKGSVTIDGVPVPFGQTDGWHMVSETELVLEGAVCAGWQAKESGIIDIGFPCPALIPPPQ